MVIAKAIRKHGEHAFVMRFIALPEGSSQDLLNRLEIRIIDLLDSRNIKKGYNVREGGSRGGQSEITRQKLRIAHLGKKLSVEHKAKIGAASKGNNYAKGCVHSPEACAEKSRRQTGKPQKRQPLSEEHKRKIGLKSKGHPVSLEQREKLRQAHLGKKMSPEAIAKMIVTKRVRFLEKVAARNELQRVETAKRDR